MKKRKWLGIALLVTASGLAVVYATSPRVRDAADRAALAYREGRLEQALRAKSAAANRWVLEKISPPERDKDYWTVESRQARAQLPTYRVIKAADPAGLAAANGWPSDADYARWPRSHGGPTSSRYSTLTQINRGNVASLEVAWTYRSGDGDTAVQSNPVFAEGMLFTPTGGHQLVALDGETGEERWRFDPKARFPARRGLVWWPGNTQDPLPRIYFPVGVRLMALYARTGLPVATFGTNGAVSGGAEGKIAPAIIGDVLVNATVEPAVNGYDVLTGKRLWSVSLSDPEAPPRAAGLPSKDEGGRPWGGMAVDEWRRIAYVTTSNPSPALVGTDRPGDNKYSISLVAIDVSKGKLLWTFQEVAHDLWDLDIAAPPVLTTIVRNGRRVDVVAAVTKYGNTLLLDRVSGEPIFDFRLRRAPTSTVPGERTAAYQPSVELPQPFVRQVFSADDVTDIGEQSRASVMAQLSGATFGFFEPHREGITTVFYGLHGGAQWPGASVDQARGVLFVAATDAPSMATIVNAGAAVSEEGMPNTPGRITYLQRCAGCHGANREGLAGPSLRRIGLKSSQPEVRSAIEQGFQAMAPVDGITAQEVDGVLDYLFTRDQEIELARGSDETDKTFNFERTGYRKLLDHEGYPGSKPPWGTLTAINLNTGLIEWKVALGEYEVLKARGIPATGTENFGGPVATAGGVVFVSGTKDAKIRGFDSASGEVLWESTLPFNGSAPPTTYEVGGRQYLVVPATGGGTLKLYDGRVQSGDAFVAFALPARPERPDSKAPTSGAR